MAGASQKVHLHPQAAEEGVLNSIRAMRQTEIDAATEYLSYPQLPYGQKIRIDKIALLNFDMVKDQFMGKLSYLPFREKSPGEFEKGHNPDEDYMDDEQVAPLIICSGETKFRVRKEIWYPMRDVLKVIHHRQAQTGKKCFPVEVFIDEANQFVVKLFKFVVNFYQQ